MSGTVRGSSARSPCGARAAPLRPGSLDQGRQAMPEPSGIGRLLDFLPPGANRKYDQQWTVSRVLFPPRVTPGQAKAIHLGDALPRRSSTLTRIPAPSVAHRRYFGRTALDGIPIRACSGRGLPRRQSPGCRAWALTPRFHPYLCLHRAASHWTSLYRRPSAVSFLWRFPSGHPGSALPISLSCGARTFLPRTVLVRRRPSVHLRRDQGSAPRARPLGRPGVIMISK